MSLILDALNRSRQETTEVPGLATAHYDGEAEPDRIWRVLPWAALTIAVLVIAWLLLQRDDAGQAHTSTSANTIATPQTPVTLDHSAREPAAPSTSARELPGAAPQQTTQTANVAAPAAATPNDVSAPLTTTPAPAVASLYAQSAPAGSDDIGTDSNTVEGARDTTDRSGGSDKTVESGTAQESAPATREEPIDIEEMVLRAREDLANARLAEHSAPFIGDLSQQLKDAIPTVFYERHDYAGERGPSSVVLNGEAMAVGGKPAPGMTVKEILPRSVVLDYRGTEFRLRALNSWVNL